MVCTRPCFFQNANHDYQGALDLHAAAVTSGRIQQCGSVDSCALAIIQCRLHGFVAIHFLSFDSPKTNLNCIYTLWNFIFLFSYNSCKYLFFSWMRKWQVQKSRYSRLSSNRHYCSQAEQCIRVLETAISIFIMQVVHVPLLQSPGTKEQKRVLR